MIKRSIARRYARAIFELARAQGALEQVQGQLELVSGVLGPAEVLGKIFRNRLVPPEEKKALLIKVLADRVSSPVLAFLQVIIDKHRENYLPEIVAEFKSLADEARRILEVEVQTALPLEKSDLEILQRDLEARLGWQVRMKTSVAPELLGGLILKVGDRVLDGSVKRRLETLRRQLVSR